MARKDLNANSSDNELIVKKKMSTRKKRITMWAYIFLTPQILFFFVFSAYPIVMSYVYSFYNWSGIGPLRDFIGLGNYAQLLSSSRFWQSFEVTFYYIIGTTILGVGGALILAIILNDSGMKGKSFYRTIYFLPVVTITAIVGVIMANIFGVNGLVNQLLQTFNISDKAIPRSEEHTSELQSRGHLVCRLLLEI